MARVKTWYVVQVTCCQREYRLARQFDPRRNKYGPRCQYCYLPIAKRRWKFISTVPATTVRRALKLATYIKKPKPRNRRRCHPATPLQIEIATIGLSDMWGNYNKIVLVPTLEYDGVDRGRKLRAVESQNVDWYIGLATHYGLNDRPGSGYKRTKSYPPLRRQVETALQRIMEGWIDPVARDEWLLDEIEESATKRGWKPEKKDELPF